MKRDPHQQATIQRFSMIGAAHWWVTFIPKILVCVGETRCERAKHFVRYYDARQFALKYAYAKNITIFD